MMELNDLELRAVMELIDDSIHHRPIKLGIKKQNLLISAEYKMCLEEKVRRAKECCNRRIKVL